MERVLQAVETHRVRERDVAEAETGQIRANANQMRGLMGVNTGRELWGNSR